MENYFELELDQGDIFKGFLSADRSQFYSKGIFIKKNKYIVLGEIRNNLFAGHGVVVDLIDVTLYEGQLSNAEKHGFGIHQKFRASDNIRPPMDAAYNVNKDTFESVVDGYIEKARQAAKIAEAKQKKV